MTETVTVQPREIVDAVYRVARVAGVDHGDADLVARWVTREQIEGRNHLDEVLHDVTALLGRAWSAERAAAADPMTSDGYRGAARDGIPLEAGNFTALTRAAKAFLVAERTLDEIA